MSPPNPPADATLDALADRLRGALIRPGDAGYDDARTVWNARIDRRPAAIAKCTGPADVVAGVNAAREQGLPLSVKGGGHHVSGSAICDDGLVLDLAAMDEVRVTPHGERVRVGAGATWGAVDRETQAFGLAVPGAQSPNVGVAGVTLGGGVGWLSRKYGLTVDNLLAADVVTADGEFVRASADAHPDLFWALRGGGGNFGVVTSFEYRTHDVGPEIYAGSLVYPLDDAPDVARRYRAFMADAPPEVRLLFGIMNLPPASVYPERIHGCRVAMLVACYAGPPAEGEQVFTPLRTATEPIADSLRPRTYASFQRVGATDGEMRTDLRSQFLPDLSDDLIDVIVAHASDPPSAGATAFVSPRGGAETAPPTDATAYPHRTAAHHLLVEARWDDSERDGDHIEWVRTFHEAVSDRAGPPAMNFLTADEGEARRRAAYGDNYERLRRVKGEWDPANLFRMTQSIPPASERSPDQ